VRRRLADVAAELSTARQLVSQAQSGIALRTLELGDVHACAAGVSQSVSMLESGRQAGAVAALSAVAPVCEGLLSTQAGGPVYPFDFADPDIVVVKGVAYAYGTNSTAGNIQIMESSDLVHWKKAGNALPALPRWARPGSTWAPAVIHLKHSYVLYYAAQRASDAKQCLSVATARRPQGPFVDATTAPLACQTALGGSIDPSPYLDAAGNPYLAWKSNGVSGQAPAIWAQALTPRGTSLKGSGPTVLLQPTEAWEGSVVEAPSMTLSGGSYFLFYSGNNWDSADYAIGVARCPGPLGPCSKPQASPLLASQPDFAGPGGEDVFTDAQGHLEMAFAAWLPGAVGYPHSRLLFIRQLVVTDGLPRLGAPS
jgi:beta-xylosidase